MSGQLHQCIFPILILVILTFPSVYGVTCSYYQKTCSQYSYTWCCESYAYCGSYSGSCLYYTTRVPDSTPSPDIPVGLPTAIIVILIVLCIICVSCCVHSQQQQRLRASVINANRPLTSNSYMQQSSQRPGRTAHVRPVYNINAASPIPSIYEEAPPSYEASIANFPPKDSSVLSPPVTASVDQTSLRV